MTCTLTIFVKHGEVSQSPYTMMDRAMKILENIIQCSTFNNILKVKSKSYLQCPRMRVPQCQPFSYDLGKGNSNFQFRFPFTHVFGKQNSRFRFRFPTTLKNGIRASVFVFGFPTTFDNKTLIVISDFRLSFSQDIEKRNLIFDFRFSFVRFYHFHI